MYDTTVYFLHRIDVYTTKLQNKNFIVGLDKVFSASPCKRNRITVGFMHDYTCAASTLPTHRFA